MPLELKSMREVQPNLEPAEEEVVEEALRPNELRDPGAPSAAECERHLRVWEGEARVILSQCIQTAENAEAFSRSQ